ncbi:MAG: alpha/beta fold hydrolase [Phycisphaeraceae bacterium]
MGLLVLFAVAAALLLALSTAALVRSLRRPPRRRFTQALARGLPTDPEPLGQPWRETALRLADGGATDAWIIAGRQPVGPTVLIVHGFADSRYGALTWVHHVLDHASEVVVFDLPGHGDAQPTHAGLGTREPADVLAVASQVATGRPVVLYGYSMGAVIAISAAALAARQLGAADGARVVGVIADGPYRHWHEPVYRELRRRRYPAGLLVGLSGLVMRVRLPSLARIDRARDAGELTVPLLVLHGCGDEICPLSAAEAIAEAGPRGRLVRFEQGCHLDLAACEPARYREAVVWLFEQVARDGAGAASGSKPDGSTC